MPESVCAMLRVCADLSISASISGVNSRSQVTRQEIKTQTINSTAKTIPLTRYASAFFSPSQPISKPGIKVARKVPDAERNMRQVESFVRSLKSFVISDGSVSQGISTIAAMISKAR